MAFWNEFGKKVVDKALDKAKPSGPLGLKIGCAVEISQTPFLVTQGSLLAPPPKGASKIVAVSRLRHSFQMDPPVFRFYLQTGDKNPTDEAFLQVWGDSDGVREISWNRVIRRHFPQTAEEIGAFTGAGYGLGETAFNLFPPDLELCSIPSGAAADALAGSDFVSFSRDCPGAEYVKPFESSEERVDSADGRQGVVAKTFFMPYARTLPSGETERLVISFEAEEDRNGKPSGRAHVDFAIQMTIPSDRIKVF